MLKMLNKQEVKDLKIAIKDVIKTEAGVLIPDSNMSFVENKDSIKLFDSKESKELMAFKTENDLVEIYNDLVLKKAGESFNLIIDIIKEIHKNIEIMPE